MHRLAVGGPAAHHVDRRIGQRADQCDGTGLFQRQCLVAVFQQHQAAACHVAGDVAVQTVFGVVVFQVGFGLADAHVRVLEQAHVVFGAEHLAHGLVQLLLGHFAGLQQPWQFLAVQGVVHAHVDAGLDRQLGSFAAVAGNTVADQLLDGAVVADGHALEAPLLAQQVVHQPGVGSGWHAVDRVQRYHHPASTGVERGAVGRQVVVVHLRQAHIHRVVVAPAFHRAIQGEVLDDGHDAVGVGRAAALERADHYLADLRGQVGIFAEAFTGTAPARVAGDVDHWREGHVQGVGRRFDGRGAADLGDGIHVPAGGQAQADRKDGALAMDGVVGEEHRDLQAAAHGGVLHRPVLGGGTRVEGTADAPGGDFFADLVAGHVRADADQAQLADLFGFGHLADQMIDERLLVLQGRGGWGGKGRLAGKAHGQAQQRQFHHQFHCRGFAVPNGYVHGRSFQAAIVVRFAGNSSSSGLCLNMSAAEEAPSAGKTTIRTLERPKA